MPTQNDIILALELVCGAVPDLAILSESIEEMRTLVEGAYDVLITDEEQTALLRAYTASVVRLGVEVACYPLGYPTTVLFDRDGNLID